GGGGVGGCGGGVRGAGDGTRCPEAFGRSLGPGGDVPVSLAAFIAAQRARYGVPHVVACRALGVFQAWLYKWLHGDVSLRRKRRAAVDAAVAYEVARRQGRDRAPPITPP